MSDESIINLSDSTKSTMRNYAMVAGFMTLFIYSAISVTCYASGEKIITFLGDNANIFWAITCCALLVFGTILAMLHKRDLVAITFILMAVIRLPSVIQLSIFDTGSYVYPYPFIVMLTLGIAMLFTRNEQRYICALILIPFALLDLFDYLQGESLLVWETINAIIAAVCLYAVLCIGLENPKFPGYRLLTADEDDETKDGSPVHFKVSGSIIGYALIMLPLTYVLIKGPMPDSLGSVNLSCGLMLILVGFLMLVAGRMKFTPFMFMMIGILMSVMSVVIIPWLFTASIIIIGVLCIFRSDRRILIGIALAINGLSVQFPPLDPLTNDALFITLTVIPLIIYAYVCFALCSDNRLKLI